MRIGEELGCAHVLKEEHVRLGESAEILRRVK